jgi:formyltetrahydrofolate deformylase
MHLQFAQLLQARRALHVAGIKRRHGLALLLSIMNKIATITVIGRDKTGVVARITNFLFEQKANIEALEEQVTRGQFSMTLQVTWKDGQLDQEAVVSGLERLGRQLDMEIRIRLTEPRRRQRMAIMVTKEPHCLQKILEAVKARKLMKVEPALVISNRRELEPLVQKAGLSFSFVPWDDRARAEEHALRLLEEYQIDFVVLARFMKILSPNFVWRYKNKIINIHPSLLPSFPGPQAYRQAYERGVKIVGVSAHFVTMHLDEGPIIAQDAFAVQPEMTLKDLVKEGQRLEASTLLKAITLYLEKRLDVYWGVVREV